jgi:hypothetical protein
LPTIPKVGLVGVKLKAMSLYPALHLLQGCSGFRRATAQDDEVIGIPHRAIPALHQVPVQRMQVEIG